MELQTVGKFLFPCVSFSFTSFILTEKQKSGKLFLTYGRFNPQLIAKRLLEMMELNRKWEDGKGNVEKL